MSSSQQSTALANALVSCHHCELLSRWPVVTPRGRVYCPRCGGRLYRRKHNSIARTWALLIAAYIFYIPANLLPIMTATSLGERQSDTIMSGVIYLAQEGQWPLAALIFFASIFVPVLKLLMLTLLLLSVQRAWQWNPKERTRIYRLTERIGRWSMVDIYVITILVALVHLGVLATIEVEIGALYFGAVVVLTILAVETFDARLIWDRVKKPSS
ncbi:MAG: PqiA family integral membrane protein [Halothiobacillaceae bacterium]|nr:MAG: PqiA family integral membrane protein [Halothiobacillaceae bacterium]